MQLVLPDIKYKESYLKALEETKDEPGRSRFAEPATNQSFEEFVAHLIGQSEPANAVEGKVPATTLWLVDNDEFIGRVQIRHELNDALRKDGGHIGYIVRPSKRRMGYGTKILKLGIQRAKEMGINTILVTCDVTNIASSKIIQANGGALHDQIADEETGKLKNRYWIKAQ